ncbi:Fe-S cluster assembly protein SufD [Salinibius halmophilus]|uniref:Fe-S cluster assembly protein SufD n=1 Tax=Salinibius halmophilus TaxID=1853216 RepID=UPI000E665A21|nr:Fe-S cluster assembly protein SufD [Salinibius halmophilus]
MSHWFENAIERGEQLTLSAQRTASLELLKNTPWPTRKTEAWKYTPLKAVQGFNATASEVLAAEQIEGLQAIDVVPGSELPTELPAGLTMQWLAADDVDASLFQQVKPNRHLFGLVNDVLAENVLQIRVAAGTEVATPIRIVQQLTAGSETHVRVLVEIEEKASLTVIEQFAGSEQSLNTLFAEYRIADDAKLEHYRLALQTEQAMSLGGSHFQLFDRSQLNSNVVGFGSDVSRIDMDVRHSGQHAFAKLNAIYLLDGKELFDLHSTIEHEMPNGTTEENIRGIAAGSARAVFNGRIHIHRDAQKTLAELNNRNLLLSNKAEINTKPELEIYADDVRCAHGATIAETDKTALYYLQSRGIGKEEAQIMLNFAFINELVDDMPNQAIAEWLRPQLRQRFAKMGE